MSYLEPWIPGVADMLAQARAMNTQDNYRNEDKVLEEIKQAIVALAEKYKQDESRLSVQARTVFQKVPDIIALKQHEILLPQMLTASYLSILSTKKLIGDQGRVRLPLDKGKVAQLAQAPVGNVVPLVVQQGKDEYRVAFKKGAGVAYLQSITKNGMSLIMHGCTASSITLNAPLKGIVMTLSTPSRLLFSPPPLPEKAIADQMAEWEKVKLEKVEEFHDKMKSEFRSYISGSEKVDKRMLSRKKYQRKNLVLKNV